MMKINKGHLVGMVHLLPLPGRINYNGSLNQIIDRALQDALILQEAGFDSMLVQNYGDAPFDIKSDASTIAHMTLICSEVRKAVKIPVGVCLLRNDGPASIAVAAASGSSFVRIKCHTGLSIWPEGMVKSESSETLECMHRLGSQVRIMADIAAPHAKNLFVDDVTEVAKATINFGKAEILILTSKSLDESIKLAQDVRKAIRDNAWLFLGGGAKPDNIKKAFSIFDGVIVGKGVKEEDSAKSPVSKKLARKFVQAARQELSKP